MIADISPTNEEVCAGLLRIAMKLFQGSSVSGTEAAVILQYAHDTIKAREDEVAERDEIIDELQSSEAQIVTWLRGRALKKYVSVADAIERGEHRRP